MVRWWQAEDRREGQGEGSLKNGAKWLQFGVKLLGILEALLPAFLVTLNHRLRSKATRLENELAVVKYEARRAEELQRVRDRHETQDDRATIDGYLDDPNAGL